MLTKNSFMAITIGLLILTTGSLQAAGNAANGADLTFDCIDCHGLDGKGDFETPAIAGLRESLILQRLRDFKSGKSESLDGMMHTYSEDRTDQDLQDQAAYWASREK